MVSHALIYVRAQTSAPSRVTASRACPRARARRSVLLYYVRVLERAPFRVTALLARSCACARAVPCNRITCASLCPLRQSMQGCSITPFPNFPDDLCRFLLGFRSCCLLVTPGPSPSLGACLPSFLCTPLHPHVQNMCFRRGTEGLLCVSRHFCPLASSTGSHST